METPPVPISADSSGLSTQTPSMNEQPSSLSLTIRGTPHTPKNKTFPQMIKMPEVFLFSYPIPSSSSIFLFAEQEEAGMWKHNDGRWCGAVHPCGWRLAVCAVSCVRCSTGRDEIKWHGVDSSGLKFLRGMREKMFLKTGPKEQHETPTYIADLIITKYNTCLLPLVWFLFLSVFCFYVCWVLFYLRWSGKLRGNWKLSS